MVTKIVAGVNSILAFIALLVILTAAYLNWVLY